MTYTSQDTGEKLRQESGAGEEQEPWGSDAYWLAPCGLLNLNSYTTQNHLSMGGTQSELGPPTSIINQKK